MNDIGASVRFFSCLFLSAACFCSAATVDGTDQVVIVGIGTISGLIGFIVWGDRVDD